jgi:hypothetical protein
MVKDELEAGNIDPIPPHLRGMADDIARQPRRRASVRAVMAWILDGDRRARWARAWC